MSPNGFYRWQKALFENAAAAFEGCSDRREPKLEQQVVAQAAKLADKDEVIAEITEARIAPRRPWGGPKASWMGPDVRDEVIDSVRTWSEKTKLPAGRLAG